MAGFITIKKFPITPSDAAPSGYASLFVDVDNRLKLLLDDGTIFVYGLNNYELAVSEGFTGTLIEYLESLHGESAYQLWLSLGNTGSAQDFLDSLKGVDGTNGVDGQSAYGIWLSLGNTGTEQDFLDSLKGADGFNGDNGLSSYQIWLNQGNTGSEQDFLDSLKGADGTNGVDGDNGTNGLSAYQIWLNQGNTGTETDFLISISGQDGKSAYQIWLDQGNEGDIGTFLDSLKGTDGTDGFNGLSAYQLWLNNGNSGTEADFLNSLKGTNGVNGTNGTNGIDGTDGVDGLSAYEIWLSLGNTGTQQDFIDSLKGADGTGGGGGLSVQDTTPTDTTTYPLWFDTTTLKLKVFVTSISNYIDAFPVVKGDPGLSAYQTWLALGNSGTEADFINSLKGADGTNGTNGTNGTGIPAGGEEHDVLQRYGTGIVWNKSPVLKGVKLSQSWGSTYPNSYSASYSGLMSYHSNAGYRSGTQSSTGLFEYIQGALSHISLRAILAVAPAGSISTIGLGSPMIAGSLTPHVFNASVSTAYNKMGAVEAIANASTTSVAGVYQASYAMSKLNGEYSESLRITEEFGICSGASNANKRMFIGIRNSISAPTDVNPSTILNIVGFGFDSTDSTIQFMYRSTGAVTKRDTGLAKPTVDRNNVYRVIIEVVSGGIGYACIEDVGASAKTIYKSPSFPVPSNVLMSMCGWCSAGGTSTAMGMGMFKMMIEHQVIN